MDADRALKMAEIMQRRGWFPVPTVGQWIAAKPGNNNTQSWMYATEPPVYADNPVDAIISADQQVKQ